MKLIKIQSDRVRIRSDYKEFDDAKINDLISISDGDTELITMVDGVQHAIVNRKGRVCPSDFPDPDNNFPKVNAMGEYDGNEELLFPVNESEG